MALWIMDYETLPNCFIGYFLNHKSEKSKLFIINNDINQIDDYVKFLMECIANNDYHISYNGLAFDSQISEYILKNYRKQFKSANSEYITREIYEFAQDLISYIEPYHNKNYIPEWKLSIKQIDLYKLNHWDSPVKRSSLKWIEYSIDWLNIQEMPIAHTSRINSKEDLKIIVKYCKNDVNATREIFKLCKNEIKLRYEINKSYNYKLNVLNASEPKVAREILLRDLSSKMDMSIRELRSMRTERSSIKLKDLILPIVDFKTNEFKDVYNEMVNLIIYDPTNLKGIYKSERYLFNTSVTFGLGGAHGAFKSGIYDSNKDMIIMTSDVSSYYPNLAIRNKFSPAHLPTDIYCNTYESYYNKRQLIPKSNSMNYTYKIILNSTFGQSNEASSFLYDPAYMLKTTINGQLLLCMLIENIVTSIPGSQLMMLNTDGIEIMMPRKFYKKYLEICSKWEKLTNLKLETSTYSKLVLSDVNSYLAQNEFSAISKSEYNNFKVTNPEYVYKEENGKYYVATVKQKGRYSWKDYKDKKANVLHKNKSALVIKKALYYNFIHNIDINTYLKNETDIFDFCIGAKARGSWRFHMIDMIKGSLIERTLQKVVRYYVSNKGPTIIKKNLDTGNMIKLEAQANSLRLFNKYEKKSMKDYDINLSYYRMRINKELEKLNITKQLSIF